MNWKLRMIAQGLYRKGLTRYCASRLARAFDTPISQHWYSFQPQDFVDWIFDCYVETL